jgi:hypothetical protein
LVKFEGGGAVGELSGVTHHTPGEKAAYSDPTNGFSLTAPAGWSFDRQEVDKKGRTEVSIIDPDASSSSTLTVQTLDTLEPEDKKSLQTYVNHKVEKSAKLLQNFQARPNSETNRTIAGQPAIGVIGDYTEGKTKKVAYGVWSFGTTNGVYFEMMTSAKDFDALKPKMDAIIDSFQTQ